MYRTNSCILHTTIRLPWVILVSTKVVVVREEFFPMSIITNKCVSNSHIINYSQLDHILLFDTILWTVSWRWHNWTYLYLGHRYRIDQAAEVVRSWKTRNMWQEYPGAYLPLTMKISNQIVQSRHGQYCVSCKINYHIAYCSMVLLW